MANEYYLTVVYDENETFSNSSFKETCECLSQETLDYLHDLNHEVTLNTIPLQLYYVILIVIGIIGNILVIYIYGRKLQKVCIEHHYRPQTKFAKVMFSQVFVCPGASRSLSWGVSVQGVSVQGDLPPPSYWNAFWLLAMIVLSAVQSSAQTFIHNAILIQ